MTAMIYMTTYNGHDSKLVEQMNAICQDESKKHDLLIIIRAFMQKYWKETKEKIGFVPFYDEDIMDNLSDFLILVCCDEDLEIIIEFTKLL